MTQIMSNFFEKTFIDLFCIKVSIILITNCVLKNNLKLPGHIYKTAIIDIFPIPLSLPFAFVSSQSEMHTSLKSEITVFS